MAALVVVVYGIVWVLVRFVGRGSAKRVRDGFLCLVVGKRRHGKSLFVARLIADRIEAGVPVVCNFSSSAGPRMASWRDAILAPRGAMVVLDEAHQWAGSRSGQSLRPAARWYIAMCGKLGHEVWIIAQHETQIAGEVRDQVNEIVECTRVAPGRHRAKSYAPHEFRKRGAKPEWTWSYKVGGPAIEVYDTLDLIPPESTRRNTYDDDVAMVVECIEVIQLRDRAGSVRADDELVDAWLDAAGVPA